jgi:hypothetical protein
MFTSSTDDIVRLRTAPNPPIAHIWEQTLAEAGIRSTVVGDYLGAGVGNLPGMQAELWVHRDDVQRAEEVLQQMHPAEPDATPEDAEKQ